MKRFIGSSLGKYALIQEQRRLMHGAKQYHCGQSLARNASVVTLRHSAATGAVAFGGLQHCGDAWCCLECAAKAAAKDYREGLAVVRYWKAQGATFAHATFTQSHRPGQPLQQLETVHRRALRELSNHRRMRALLKRHNIVGYIHAGEIVYNDGCQDYGSQGRAAVRGWNDHSHRVYVGAKDTDWRDFGARLVELWSEIVAKVAEREGVKTKADIGVGVKLVCENPARGGAEGWIGYMTKSGNPRVKDETKGLTHVGLLEFSRQGVAWAGARYAELAVCKKRRKFYMSPALRRGVHLPTNAHVSDLKPFARLSREVWGLIVAREAQSGLVEAMQGGDAKQVVNYVTGLLWAERTRFDGLRLELGRMRDGVPLVHLADISILAA